MVFVSLNSSVQVSKSCRLFQTLSKMEFNMLIMIILGVGWNKNFYGYELAVTKGNSNKGK